MSKNNTIDLDSQQLFNSKKMLPSKFSRTQSYNFHQQDHFRPDKSDLTVGPASYEKEPIIGNPSNTVYYNQPRYSIP